MGLRVLVVVVLLAGVAHADDKPWAAGVSPTAQKTALDLYQAGNAFFEQAQYKEALEKYDAALQSWDHPSIHYNAAVCLINLDRPVEAYDHLVAAMRFGAAPLGKDMFAQGQAYEKQLAGRVGELDVRCDEPGAQVSLDGKPLFRAPGTKHLRVLPGEHQLVAEKPSYQTETKQVHVDAGAVHHEDLALAKIVGPRALHRPLPRWLPWTAMGAGAVVALVGVFPFRSANHDYAAYDRAVAASFMPGNPNPPMLNPSDAALKPHADSEAKQAYILWGVGGGLAATGFVLVLLNAPRLEPIVTNERVGLAYTARF